MAAVEVEMVQSSPFFDNSLIDVRVDLVNATVNDDLRVDSQCRCRDSSGNLQPEQCSRLSVNTHDSILNITEDDDDDDDDDEIEWPEDETPMMFPDMQTQPVDEDMRTKESSCCDYTLSRPSVLERFLDGLCGTPTTELSTTVSYRGALEVDILHILGCSSNPKYDELRWDSGIILCQPNSTCTSPAGPQRKNFKQRAVFLQRLRKERLLPRSSAGISPTSVTWRSRSLDHAPRLVPEEDDDDDDGYESDPELHLPVTTRLPSQLFSVQQNSTEQFITSCVHETLNLVWTLTYHAPKVAESVCRVWMERGTLIENNTRMLEPTLMWRAAVHDGTVFEKTPNAIRLLNICRIVPANASLDRKKYPLARVPCSFWVRTADNEAFLFQACSSDERNMIIMRWKHCVTRFATLAVMEDMDAIAREFFLPTEYLH